jgi:hypothetical protein
MSSFVEDAMRKINKMSEAEILQLKENFHRVMRLTYDFFGDRNFRVPLEGKTTRGRINIAVLESVGYFFSKQSDDFLISYKKTITTNFQFLLENSDYLDAVQKSTGDKYRVIRRFRLAQSILNPFLAR